ncbi:hypothetical protein ES703_41393 [subsurface metagenome]
MSRYRAVWNGGKSIDEHRVVWEEAYGIIPEGYEIHHINGLPRDNRLSNLMILPRQFHARLHQPTFRLLPGGQWEKRCSSCKRFKPLSGFHSFQRRTKKTKVSVQNRCKPCNRKDGTPRGRVEWDHKRKEVIKDVG